MHEDYRNPESSPEKRLIEEDYSSLQELESELGTEHAVAYAQKVLSEIERLIERDLASAASESVADNEKWADELQQWKYRQTEIELFISERLPQD